MSQVWENLNPQAVLTVMQAEWISDRDRQVLAYCYQPIIGSDSYALYMTLLAQVHLEGYVSKELRHRDLMEQLVMGKEQYVKARRRLEAIGLVRTFVVKGEEDEAMRYVLRAPLAADKLFSDAIMSTLLLDRLGAPRFNELLERFSVHLPSDDRDWQEITASFQDAYRIPRQYVPMDSQQEKRLVKTNQRQNARQLENSSFDYDYFKQLLQGSFVSDQAINQDVLAMTKTLHVMYGYDEVDLQRFALDAFNVRSNTISLERYQAQALKEAENHGLSFSKQQAKEQASQENTSEKDFWKSQGLGEKELALTQQMHDYPSMTYIKSIKQQRHGYVSQGEAKTIQELLQSGVLNAGVVNMLIHYFLVQLDNKSLNKAWMERTADDWAQEKIDTPEAAMLYLKGRRNKQKEAELKRQQAKQNNRYYRKTNYQEVEPAWFKEGQDKTEKNSTAKIDAENKKTSQNTKEATNENKDAQERMKAMIARFTEGDDT
ncbi:replication initiation and membrane attachment family protein [Aerococcus kribbianus]|uniref:DnaD domain protein n=1 Tax=Aerococcus kribbianus TaxID=2999064 RepID=A0A9X3FNE9_9LACT|nr:MULTISPECIES: DnaD domain protein [unclassified Aerococcus]MCZ0717762.1 DnaD domain protein [Aerococcus sp. YH-aer221]MCZ0726050.1 DnaD domain protein [Aerococcus sp. YH-aer222]